MNDMNFFVYSIVFFVAMTLALLFYVIWKLRNRGLTKEQKKYFLSNWYKISNDNDLRHAILNADKLLDKLLEASGYKGTTGEKIKNAKKVFRDYNGIWKAHKLRNRLAHELDPKMSTEEASIALKLFEKAYRDLGLFK